MQKEKFNSVTKVITELLKRLNNRMGNIEHSQTLALATLLDPRFKLALFADEKATDLMKSHCSEFMAAIWSKKKKIDRQVIYAYFFEGQSSSK